nr:hypothetical protein GCM10020063_056010 [Dactylosporangium thailandense]
MPRFLLRRLAAVPLTLAGVSVLVFLATDVLPGDVGRTVLGREASAEAVLAGARHDTWLDRAVSAAGLALGATPEFVTGVILLVVFAVHLHGFPVSAQPAPATARSRSSPACSCRRCRW